jgi:rhodanese-related sulfurtransferase
MISQPRTNPRTTLRPGLTLALVGLLVVALLLAACGGAAAPEAASGSATAGGAEFPKNAAGYADISVDQLAGILEDKDFVLVNVHIPYEGELPQTDLFIPFDQIEDHLAELPARDAPIVLYCRSGSMSTTAAEVLVEQGYTNVLELDGGFNAWQSAGNDLLNK